MRPLLLIPRSNVSPTQASCSATVHPARATAKMQKRRVTYLTPVIIKRPTLNGNSHSARGIAKPLLHRMVSDGDGGWFNSLLFSGPSRDPAARRLPYTPRCKKGSARSAMGGAPQYQLCTGDS